jgi:amidase
MTRSVADAAIMLEAIAGKDLKDSTSLSEPVPDIFKDINKGIADLRIGFDRDYALSGVDHGLGRAILKAIEVLEHLGAEIVSIKVPDLTDVLTAWPVICSAEAAIVHQAHYPSQAHEYGEYFREFLERGTQVTEAELSSARKISQVFSMKFQSVLSSVDAMISPAAGIPFAIPEGLQYQSLSQWNQAYSEILQASGVTKPQVSFTFPHNFAGTPALVVPCGFSDRGFPYTMQLSGGLLKEAILCRIGHAYETATEWHLKHPSV